MINLDAILPWKLRADLKHKQIEIDSLKHALEAETTRRILAEQRAERHSKSVASFANWMRVTHRVDQTVRPKTIRERLMRLK